MRQWVRRLLAPLSVALLVAACSYITPMVVDGDRGEAVGGPPVAAERVVAAWLDAVIGGTTDLGWGLLYPSIRTDMFRSEDRYRREIGQSDWDGFRYRILGTDLRDGEYHVRVELPGTTPAFLQDWGFIQMETDSVGIVGVRLGVGREPSGIQAVGGPASSTP